MSVERSKQIVCRIIIFFLDFDPTPAGLRGRLNTCWRKFAVFGTGWSEKGRRKMSAVWSESAPGVTSSRRHVVVAPAAVAEWAHSVRKNKVIKTTKLVYAIYVDK